MCSVSPASVWWLSDFPLTSSLLPCFLSSPPSSNAVQQTLPINDDGQLTSSGSGPLPIPWLTTHAVQLTMPIGDDSKLMSGKTRSPPVLGLSTNSIQPTAAAPLGSCTSHGFLGKHFGGFGGISLLVFTFVAATRSEER